MTEDDYQKINVLLDELYFKVNNSLEEYINVIEGHEILPNSYFELKYSLYKSNLTGFNSLYDKAFLKETILLFYKDLLCAVYYKFKGNQLDYFHNILSQYMPKEHIQDIITTDRNSIVYKFTEELLIEVLFTENNTTGICVMNSFYRKDQLKSEPEKEYEVMLIKNNISITN
ncbi:hypothetical protein PK35_04375 [Tamlana nanhaiensis]|uniref:Uncharacterized protein n=1 Tax=Neotamlana nanhaiensis TaxID=1382798 RepID=A0A0D7W5K4_9FLAO|nr:hypothetical protein [Tamlana nanhaiensis]KJD33978.1 hypothetical protein PK35_04375 [Tamlana nanhaiensis]